ncbi:MAG: hypothetical protein J3K34DRAFT_410071 [Monoraphidium minutum]|nr:MAG: hypothetical protein J3K34DRAFT_410071 [Monoraphidium minutum]
MWVIVVFVYASLMPLYVVYSRELRCKTQYLNRKGLLRPQPDGDVLGLLGSSQGLRHLAALVCVPVLSVLIAEIVVLLGFRYDCAAA